MPITESQSHYRWRNDDGSETGATWQAAIDVDPSGFTTGQNFRIRLATNTAGSGSDTFTPKLQYNKNGAGWNDVTNASSVVRSASSTQFTDNNPTTNQIASGTGFATGRMDSSGAVGSTVTLSDTGNDFTEHEFCCQVRDADVSDGDTIQFRLIKTTGSAYNSYTNTPTFTVPTRSRRGPPPLVIPYRVSPLITQF